MSVNTRTGTFVLSLDTEIAWGTFDCPDFARFAPQFDSYRANISRLITLLDSYQIATTWAFVGHLFLDSCQRHNGTTHPEVLRPQYDWYPHDWHQHDPGTDLASDPWWYGRDILDQVLAAPTPHEIGTHTFSHVVLGDPACDGAIAQSQLEACRALHESRGLEMVSLVYPRNQIGHLQVAADSGIIAYRGREAAWYERRLRGPAHRAAHLADRYLASTPPTYSDAILAPDSHGLVNVPASQFLLPMDGIRGRIPPSRRVLQAKRGLSRAARRAELYHLWFHPFNLGSHPAMFTMLEEILAMVAADREAGRLRILTMAQAAWEARGE